MMQSRTAFKPFIVLAAAFIAASAFYILNTGVRSPAVPVFVYEEVAAAKPSARPVPLPKAAKAAPVPPQSVPMPLFPPKAVTRVMPEYPVAALEKGIEGVVVIEAVITSGGLVSRTGVKSSSGNASLDSAALRAVSQWAFSPALQGGDAVPSIFEVPVRFSIQ